MSPLCYHLLIFPFTKGIDTMFQFLRHPIWTILTWILRVLVSLIVLLILALLVVRLISYHKHHITTENGIDEGIFVTLGGQEQYLLIRGKDTSNPVIIWLHGGPSGSDAYVNYTFDEHLTDAYTLVSWDQRGCGRTYFRNQDSDPNNESATFEQAQTDLDELVDYIRDRFKTDKVIIVGHSYGTMLGSKYTLDHPEKVAAYIGVGQVVSFESEIYSYEDALFKANILGDDTTQMVAAYETYQNDPSLTNMLALRGHVGKYHKPEIQTNTIWMGVASPYMGIDDIRWFFKQLGLMEDYLALNKQLYDYVLEADVRDYGTDYKVPVGFITGSCDWTTPVKYAEDYCELITAPQKQIHIMEGCGHAPQYDLPEEFCTTLRSMLDEYLQ